MFEILEHTADVGFRASAPALAELFEQAAQALVAVAMDNRNVTPRKTIPLSAEGESLESLLVNWLNDVLYCLDGEGLAVAECKVRTMDAHRVTGEAIGEPRDPARHEPRMIVKGVTYHQLKIVHDQEGWSCEVYLDI